MNNYKTAGVLGKCDVCEEDVAYCDLCGADFGLGGMIFCDKKQGLHICCNCREDIKKKEKIQVGKCYNCLPKLGGNYKNMLCIVRKLSEDMFKVLQIKGDVGGSKYGYEIYYSTYHKENLPHKLAQEISLKEFRDLHYMAAVSLGEELKAMEREC